jgi:hypothetical protein
VFVFILDLWYNKYKQKLNNEGKKMEDYFGNFKIWHDHKGYPCIWIDRKEIKLHVYIWEKVNGNKPKGYEIHHKDFNKYNYLLENLGLMTNSDHRRIHAGWISENGKWIKKPCNQCKRILPLKDFYYIQTRKIESNYCKVCHNKIMSERNLQPKNIDKIKIYKRNYYREHYGKQK